MRVLFEDLAAPLRFGGIDSACDGLVHHLAETGLEVRRRELASDSLSGWRPDVVHFHGIWSPALMRRWFAWKREGVPSLLTVHGMLEPWALTHKSTKKKLAWALYQKRVLQKTNCLHATSLSEAANLQALGLEAPIIVIPNGVDVPRAISSEQVDINTEGAGVKTALFLSRIHPKKGLDLLLKAWSRVRPPNWRLIIVGPDEDDCVSSLQTLCRTLDLSASTSPEGSAFEEILWLSSVSRDSGFPEVTFCGALFGADKQRAFEASDLFILPTHSENFGIAVAEAMAYGLPVITTHGAPWEVLERESCGWWTPVSVDEIERALEDATSRPAEQLHHMGSRGRNVVLRDFAWDKIARDFSGCYRWLLGESEVPDSVLQ